MTNQVSTEFLQAFADAWNAHDLDAMMSFMADDCVFQQAVGPEIDGKRFDGVKNVRVGYKKLLDTFPDARWQNFTHFVVGDRGVSEWIFTATGVDGRHVKVGGCDLFTFRDGKIAVKNSFRKLAM